MRKRAPNHRLVRTRYRAPHSRYVRPSGRLGANDPVRQGPSGHWVPAQLVRGLFPAESDHPSPAVAEELRGLGNPSELVCEAIDRTE